MHLAMEAIIENKILVSYKNTSKMLSDGSSKIVTGKEFKKISRTLRQLVALQNYMDHKQFFWL